VTSEGPLSWLPHPRKELSQFTPGDGVLTAPPLDDPLNTSAAALRRIIDALARTAPDGEHLPATSEQLLALADSLEKHTRPVPTQLFEMWQGEGIARHDPATGQENPMAPPLQLFDGGDGWAVGTVTLGLPYQGPPGNVHGGICALLLDAALAVANHLAGTNGMTAKLEMSYKRPTPLSVPLTVRSRQLSVDGRKRFTMGEIVADGEVTVSAQGLFIARRA
jgi:acyl-coenzyme A thioesterase PaaI-like protein